MAASMEAANAEYEKAFGEAQDALNQRATRLSAGLQASNDLFAKTLAEINKQLADTMAAPAPVAPVPPAPATAAAPK